MPRVEVNVNPEVIRWAVGYSRREEDLWDKYGDDLACWLDGSKKPTPASLKSFAKQARVPVGYLYGSRIPSFGLSVGDPGMRTLGDRPIRDPSPDLIDTVYACQRRQSWYRNYAETRGLPEVRFVDTLSLNDDPASAAETIARELRWDATARKQINKAAYRRTLSARAEDAGLLVMVNGVVGANNRRKLDNEEFRGFSLADRRAPLIFVNNRDAQSAQVFTLAHEMAHIWLGRSGISAPENVDASHHPVEKWCNSVAAELLVPRHELYGQIKTRDPVDSLPMLRRHFKVSEFVLIRRLHELGLIDTGTYRTLYSEAHKRARDSAARSSGGGDYYLNTLTRVSRRFARAVYTDATYGGTMLGDAYRLLSVTNSQQMEKLGRKLRATP